MTGINGKSMIPLDVHSGWRPKIGDNLLDSLDGRNAVVNDFFETDPADFKSKDIAVLNMLCASTIKGTEHLDIRKCLARLNALTTQVKAAIDRNIHNQPKDPDYARSPPMWKMAWVFTVLKRNFGAAYNPEIAAKIDGAELTPMDNARDVFINGVLDENRHRRHGTCASIPLLIAAIGRRLGYPIKLAVAGRHIIARWDGDGARFNIEATGPVGLVVRSDAYYRQWFKNYYKPTPAYEKSSFVLRSLTPAEEFALFMTFRVEALCWAERYDETLLWSARSLQFSPDDPGFVFWATRGLNSAMRQRWNKAHPNYQLPPMEELGTVKFNAGAYLTVPERSLCLTISAHQAEQSNNFALARSEYEEACRQNLHGNNEQRDLQRFLKQHNLPRRTGPLLPPQNPIQRRFKLFCKPHEEANTLIQLEHEFEANGEYLKARDALHDLYLFDPGKSEVFLRFRALEKRPEFQQQLKSLIAETRKTLSVKS